MVRAIREDENWISSRHVLVVQLFDNSQSELSSLIGQLQVHYFSYESPWSSYEPEIMWSNLIGRLEVQFYYF